MTTGELSPQDQAIKEHCSQGNFTQAITGVIDAYGQQIFGHIMLIMRNDDHAQDAYAIFCEDVWKGLENFRWQSKLKTWLYSLARNASFRFSQRSVRKHAHTPIDNCGFLSRLITDARISTTLWRRASTPSRLQLLRSKLTPEEQELLTLRIEARLSWKEIAQVVSGFESDESTLKRKAATYRKKYARLSDKLKAMAIEEGMVPHSKDSSH